MAMRQSLNNCVLCKIFASSPLRNTILVSTPHVFRVNESNNDKIKDVCMTRFQDGRHINTKSGVSPLFHF